MTEDFWWQAAVLAWLAYCFFHWGARENKIEMNASTWRELATAVAMVVLFFALMTGGRGCVSAGRFDADTCIADTGC